MKQGFTPEVEYGILQLLCHVDAEEVWILEPLSCWIFGIGRLSLFSDLQTLSWQTKNPKGSGRQESTITLPNCPGSQNPVSGCSYFCVWFPLPLCREDKAMLWTQSQESDPTLDVRVWRVRRFPSK